MHRQGLDLVELHPIGEAQQRPTEKKTIYLQSTVQSSPVQSTPTTLFFGTMYL
jgi:hypothetical protein